MYDDFSCQYSFSIIAYHGISRYGHLWLCCYEYVSSDVVKKEDVSFPESW